MGTASIRHIVESTVATYLSTQTGLTTVTFLTGDSAATQTLPKAVVLHHHHKIHLLLHLHLAK